MSSLKGYLNEKVTVVSTDGSFFIGILEGFDHSTNIVLREAQERLISPTQPPVLRDLGTFIIRGEMVATVGLVDRELDSQIEWDKVRGESFGTTRHKS